MAAAGSWADEGTDFDRIIEYDALEYSPCPSVWKRWGIIAVVRQSGYGIESTPHVFGGDSGLRGSGRMQRPSGVGPVQKGSSAMLWRHLCLVRASTAAGLLGGMMLLGGSAATAQDQAPAPAASRPEPSTPPASIATETVDLLEAGKAGDLTVVARGQGQDKVKMTIRNTTKRRLNVIVPPGLVAASKVAQAGGGGGGRLQSIGLGSVANREGAFGASRPMPRRPDYARFRRPANRAPGRSRCPPASPSTSPSPASASIMDCRPLPARYAHRHGRGHLFERPPHSQGAPEPLHDGYEPRGGPGGDVASLQ